MEQKSQMWKHSTATLRRTRVALFPAQAIRSPQIDRERTGKALHLVIRDHLAVSERLLTRVAVSGAPNVCQLGR